MEEKKLDLLKKALLVLRTETLTEADKAHNGEIDTLEEERADVVDRSALESERNFTLRLLDRDRKLIKKIDDALLRLAGGDFGLCEECGEEIEHRRLLARPVATLCIDCKETQELEERRLA